jgi:cytochrome P450
LSDVDLQAIADGERAMANNPQPVYRLMRENMPAVEIVPSVSGPMGIVCHRRDIEEAFRHPEIFASTEAVNLQNVRPLIPLNIDPPDHKKYRKILDPLFAPRAVARLEQPVADLANRLMDAFEGEKEIDFAAAFSVPLPSQVFITLLGLPLEELSTFLAMKDGIIRPQKVVGGFYSDPAVRAHQKQMAESIYEYFEELLDERAAEPRDDLVSGFLATEIDGERLSREEILDICFLFLIAGLDTVTDSLSCFYAFLAQNPDHRRRIVDDPSVVNRAVEELLRWESPVPGVPRQAVFDTELNGCPVKAGDMVSVSIGAANLDPGEFGNPFEITLDRDPNRHVAFGGGVHRCLGSHLARRELRVTLREWHKRIPDYQLASGAELTYLPGLRQVESLPLVWGT